METRLKICFVASEVTPYAKTGGLADVAAALPRYLAEAGHDVRLFLPLYRSIDTSDLDLTPVGFLQNQTLHFGNHAFTYSVLQLRDRKGHGQDGQDHPLGTYFLHCPALYGRDGIYGGDDEWLRFGFLSRVVIECCQRMGWGPDVFHCNDWHTALLPFYLRHHYSWDQLFAHSRTLLTLHNLAYQGVFPAAVIESLDLGGFASKLHQDDLQAGRLNFLVTGLLYADVLSTVSRTYALEIQTEEFGRGLHPLLRARRESLVGIVNGVDYEDWNPAQDALIPHTYDANDLSGKHETKLHLLRSLGLDADPRALTFGVVSRLTGQKGFDLFFDVLPALLRARGDVRLTILGSGEAKYQDFFQQLQQAFPGRVCYYRGYSEELAHLIEAGADSFLMPSRYEPCGLNQMYSLRYGTPPIVRKTGGLADTVQLWDGQTREGTGFVFEHYNTDALRWAISYALDTYADPDAWEQLMRNGMAQDFSWQMQGVKYEELYRLMTET